jgi:hypothetical protein
MTIYKAFIESSNMRSYTLYCQETHLRCLDIGPKERSSYRTLVILTPELLKSAKLIEDIVAFRNAEVSVLSDYTKVSVDSTRNYLIGWIYNPKKIFFLLFEVDDEKNVLLIGHIGVEEKKDYCSLENFRRGRSGRYGLNKSAIFDSEIFILDSLRNFGYREVRLKTMSYNRPLIEAHTLAGFSIHSLEPVDSSSKRIFRNGLEISQDKYKMYSEVSMVIRL